MNALPSIADDVLERLIRDGAESFEEFLERTRHRHHLLIPCDHEGIYPVLRSLRSRAQSFLEFGSATGVVTIMADLLGFEACGIELEPWLHRRSIEIAERFESASQFAEGSFVPPDYADEVELLMSDFDTPVDGACAYDDLPLELDDFDLIFAYPRPGEEDWLVELVRRHARPGVLLLRYDAKDGYRLARIEGGEDEVVWDSVGDDAPFLGSGVPD